MFLPLLVALSFALYPSSTFASNQVPTILLAIATCESGQRQFNRLGHVLTNATHDYGYFQINRIHIKAAKAMGYDIMTEEGNIAFALYLYHTQGVAPWYSSKHCWGSSLPPPSQSVLAVNL